MSQLEQTELIPFVKAIAKAEPASRKGGDGIASIMTGHMALPHLTPNAPNTPASLSREISTDLLRTKLGFEGVVVTDCLEMDAVAELPGLGGVPGGAVQALKAGADIVMICHTFELHVAAVEAAWKAVESGELDVEELRVSGRRVATLKDRFSGSWDEVISSKVPMSSEELAALKVEHAELAKKAYAKSTTLVRDPASVIGKFSRTALGNSSSSSSSDSHRQRKLVVFTPEMEVLNRAVDDAENIIRTKDGKVRNTAGPSYEAFATFFDKQLTPMEVTVEHIVTARTDLDDDAKANEAIVSSIKESKAIIFATRNADQASSSWQLFYLSKVLSALSSIDESSEQESMIPVCILATCGPYDLLSPQAGLAKGIMEKNRAAVENIAYVASYEFTVAALEAAARVILGDHQAVGICPVRAAAAE